MLSQVAWAMSRSVPPGGLSRFSQLISLTKGIMRPCQGRKMPIRKKKYSPLNTLLRPMERDSA